MDALCTYRHLRGHRSMVRRTHRGDWLQAAIRLLIEEGPSSLTIDSLCAAMKKTKGSFYHHFKDVHELRMALIADWEERHTDALVQQANSEVDPVAAIAVLSEPNCQRLADKGRDSQIIQRNRPGRTLGAL